LGPLGRLPGNEMRARGDVDTARFVHGRHAWMPASPSLYA